MWIAMGDLNTSLGALMGWSRFYWTTDDPPFARVNIASAKAQNNRHGDFVISQGFQTSHEESTIGVDETSRKHCNDAHNMVTLRGDFPRHQSSVSLPAPTSSTQSGHAPTDPLGTQGSNESSSRTSTGTSNTGSADVSQRQRVATRAKSRNEELPCPHRSPEHSSFDTNNRSISSSHRSARAKFRKGESPGFHCLP